MLKKILNLDGAQELSKKQLKSILGGLRNCKPASTVPCTERGPQCMELECQFLNDPL